MDIFSFEALAHYTRGLATMFFIMCAITIYNHRHQNRMLKVLAVAIIYITFGFIKDAVFLFPLIANNPHCQNVVSLIDVLCIPFVCCFFFEATRPGFITKRHFWSLVLPFSLIVPVYFLFYDFIIVQLAYIYGFIFSIVAFVIIWRNVKKYSKIIADNYSYTKNISVLWVGISATIYFLWFIVYYMSFSESTWAGEVFFDIFTVTLWSTIWALARHHRVISELTVSDKEEQPSDTAVTEIQEDGQIEKAEDRDRYYATMLRQMMEEDKKYLDSHITLSDLARELHTNRLYLSDYINRQGKTFYDFINEFRIAEACRIIKESNPDQRIPLTEVASQSGFNSISSFNRYFFKIKGMAPSAYQRLCATQA